jgi:hypothetical protein
MLFCAHNMIFKIKHKLYSLRVKPPPPQGNIVGTHVTYTVLL